MLEIAEGDARGVFYLYSHVQFIDTFIDKGWLRVLSKGCRHYSCLEILATRYQALVGEIALCEYLCHSGVRQVTSLDLAIG